LPPSLRAIIARCIERDPARRYQSVEELAAALAPLATMHERFRGRSTGAFSRHLMEEELALRHGPASARWSRVAAAPGTWQHAAASLHAWGTRLWASALPRYAGLGAASLLLGGVGIWLAGVRWMAPPPSELSIRAEPVSASEAMSDPIVESVLPLETPRSEPSTVSTAVSTTGAAASSARDEATTADERASKRRQTFESRARPTSSQRASTAVTPTAASADKHEGGSSSDGRSRVRLVKDRQRPAPGQGRPAAVRSNDASSARDTRKKEGPAKRDGAKKARSVPARSHTMQSSAATPEP
jgi:hypothetical protein